MTTPAEIIRCLAYDGYSPEEGSKYCRQIALNVRYNAFGNQRDVQVYQEAADRLEKRFKAERLALDYVSHLESENRHLLERIVELEKIIVGLIEGNI